MIALVSNQRPVALAISTTALAVLAAVSVGAQTAGDELEFFRNQVFPILRENCLECHGGGKHKGGLELTSRQAILSGGETGPAVNLVDPEASLLLDMISYRDSDHEMPPKEKLPVASIQLLTQWVAKGLPYDPALEIQSEKEEGQSSGYLTRINEKTKNYWAFRTLVKPTPEKTNRPAWNKNPIDAFILSQLQEKELEPNPPASRQQLIRRAYYDLIGLPPTVEAVHAFEQDDAPDAFEKVIDHLLSLPQYGEKWGRHWLDLVRYAETNGYERDGPKPEAWRYRDYVIQAFNQDKPYDQFIREQLAGDELESANTESIIATGFQRMGIWDDEPADPDQAYYDALDDVVSTTSSVFLGLTVGCARCHDHKIDPIPQKDYYRMMAFFHNTLNNIQQRQFKKSPFTLNTLRVIANEAERSRHEALKKEHESKLKALESEVKAFEALIAATFSNPEKEDAEDRRTREQLYRDKRAKALDKSQLDRYLAAKKEFNETRRTRLPQLTSALSIRENGRRAPETFLLIRGNAHAKGDKVRPGYPTVLGFRDPVIPQAPSGTESSGRRRVLADWITSPENPLTARVMANRVWYYHFGRGIVRSPSNFGQNGEQPTHPVLLDYLAATLIEGGWSLKAFHKEVMLSRTYQMSSKGNAKGMALDPTNNNFWRFNMRRLTAEEIRDSIINVTGQLNLKMGGPSVYTEVSQEVLQTSSRPDIAWGQSSQEDRRRRSVYVYVKRSLHEPMLKAFDSADTDSSCSVRFATTVPTQSLTMMNSAFLNQQAIEFAERLRKDAGNDRREQVRLGLQLTTNRDPSAREISDGLAMMDAMAKASQLDDETVLNRFCLMALNLNEFVYLD